MLRLGAIAIALLPVVLGITLRAVAWGPWVGVGLAIAGGIALTIVRPRDRSLVLLGTMLAVFSGLAAPQLSVTDIDRPSRVIDLRHEDLPDSLRGPATVTGFFRDEWVLAEYQSPEGSLPQQNQPAPAQLVPFLGVQEGPIPLRGAILVVRIEPQGAQARGLRTVSGRARALEPELLATLVQASGVPLPDGVDGILLDTLKPVDAEPPWLRAGLVTLAFLAAFACLWIATRSPPPGRQ